MKLLLVLALSCCAWVDGIEPEPKKISFQQLEGLSDHFTREIAVKHLERELAKFHQKRVQIRGFLAPISNKEWVLGPLPSVKSCCPSPVKLPSQQLFVEGDFTDLAEGNAVTLEGLFMIVPVWDSNGSLIQLYRLKEATLLVPTSFSWAQLSALFFGAVLLGCLLISGLLILKNRREMSTDS